MTRNKIILIALAVVALAAGWHFGSPRWTLLQMAKAAEARDSDKLAGYIDFPTLRETSKAQIRAQMVAQVTESSEQDGFGAIGAMMGLAMIDPMIDSVLTPETMRVAFAKTAAPGEQKKRPFGIDTNDVEIVQSGLDEFRLRKRNAKGEEGDLIFRRHGLGWKLTEIRIPDDLMKDGAER